jgi:hypothetical protein
MNASKPSASGWSKGTAVLFRFSALYFGLFSLATQIVGSLVLVPGLSFRGFGALWPMRSMTSWIGTALLGIEAPLDFSGAGGETLAFGIQTAWILAAAVVGTLAWTLAARGQSSHAGAHDQGGYAGAHEWFRFFVRLALAGQMFEYGITKIIPNQFEAPALTLLVTPAGDLALNTLLWTTIGSSPGYQMLTGWAELLAGVLLVLPKTVLLGALVCLVDMLHVFALNMEFDIGLKLTTLHLILLAGALIVPDLGRLGRFFVRNEDVAAPFGGPGRTWAGSRTAASVMLFLGVYLVGMQVRANVGFWYSAGGGSPRSALYGIWDVEEMGVSGVERPVALFDYDRRWRRLVFDEPGTMAIQRTDDSFQRFGALIDEGNGTIELSRPASPTWSASLRFTRDMPDRLVLDGTMDGTPIRAVLRRRDEDTFRLLNSHFRWLRPDSG